MNLSSLYYSKYAAAYIRGMAAQSTNNEKVIGAEITPTNDQTLVLPQALIKKNLEELSEEEIEEILELGRANGLKLYRFKNTHDNLPRVKRVLGFLRSIEMGSLLDVGSGRGAFLWPCLQAFPYTRVLSIDLLPHRINMLQTVCRGGVSNLSAMEADIYGLSLDDKSHDVVTMLEVLEHIPNIQAAICSAVRIARKYIVVTVPSKPDNNPEHLRLFTKEILTNLFNNAGCARLRFDGVLGHLFMIAALEDSDCA